MVITPLIAALLIGTFWTGVATTAVVSNSDVQTSHSSVIVSDTGDDAHIAACHAKFKSYNESTDKYLGFDGSWHVCNLESSVTVSADY